MEQKLNIKQRGNKMRKYADYEYKTKRGFIRIEKQENGWCWRFFHVNGKIISSNELGELFNLKREAKRDAFEYVNHITITNIFSND